MVSYFYADILQTLKSVLYSQSVLYSHNLTRSFLDWTPILYSKRFSILGDVVSQIMKPLVIWGHELIFPNWPQVLTARSGVLSENIHYRQMILRSTMLFKGYSLWIVISADTPYLVRQKGSISGNLSSIQKWFTSLSLSLTTKSAVHWPIVKKLVFSTNAQLL